MALSFLPSTPFRTDLEAEVNAYFDESGRRRRDVPRMYAKTAVLFTWLAGSYTGLVFFAHTWWMALPLAISLGLAIAGIGFSVQHDGGHSAYSDRHGVNRMMAFSLDLIGGSSYFWSYKHNIAHHTYPNITGADDDLSVGGLGRFSPHDRSHAVHRVQHFYMWLFYALLPIRWQLIDDFHSFVDPGIATTKVPRPRGWDLARFWLGKTWFGAAAFLVPLLLHSFLPFLLWYTVAMVTLGLTLATVFQLAHVVEEAEFPMPVAGRIERDWYAHQLDTTVDFARENRVVTWYVGGLNFQIEHHLFPRICHVHYPALSRVVERVAAKHGIRYRCNDTVWGALRSHYRSLRRLGRPNAVGTPGDAVAGGAG